MLIQSAQCGFPQIYMFYFEREKIYIIIIIITITIIIIIIITRLMMIPCVVINRFQLSRRHVYHTVSCFLNEQYILFKV